MSRKLLVILTIAVPGVFGNKAGVIEGKTDGIAGSTELITQDPGELDASNTDIQVALITQG